MLGFDGSFAQVIFFLLAIFGFSVFVRKKIYLSFKSKDIVHGVALLIIFCSFAALSTLFPGGRIEDAAFDTTLFFSGLPGDALIPYNVSRFLLEGLNPNTLEIVPGWYLADRGPLMGLINAYVFLLFGVQETTQWFGASTGSFFIYQVTSVFFNGLSLLAVWLFATRYFSKRAAVFSVLVLVTNYFYALNILFSWPKFYMAFLFFVAFWVWKAEKRNFLAGVLSGACVLAHDSGIFVVAALFVLILYKEIRKRNFFKPQFIFSLGLLALLAPWNLAKYLYFNSSPRLVYMHLFCYQGEDVNNLSFSQVFKSYMSENSSIDILLTRFYNFLFPINPLPAFNKLAAEGGDIFSAINSIAHFGLVQAWASVGIPFLIIFFYAFLKLSHEKTKSSGLVSFVAVGVGAAFFLALISGCKGNTLNHIWIYPLYLSAAVMIGYFISSLEERTDFSLIKKLAIQTLFALGLATNLFISFFYLYYRPVLRPYLHASVAYQQALLVLFCISISYIFSLSMRRQ